VVTDLGHGIILNSETIITERDMWIVGMQYEMVGAPALTLHHAMLYQLDVADLECPNEGPRILMSVSQDQAHTQQAQFAEGYAVFIPKGAPLILNAMIHNPEPPLGPGDTYENVSLKVIFTLAPETTKPLTPVTFHLLRLSDGHCGQNSYSFRVPPKRVGYTFSATDDLNDPANLRITKPSRIVYWGAHVHGWEGAQVLNVKKNGEIVEAFPTTISNDDPYRYDTPHGNRDIPLMAGDVISLEAVYNNETEKVVRGAMGQLGLFIAEE